jgi:hypothetical protein
MIWASSKGAMVQKLKIDGATAVKLPLAYAPHK